MKLLTSDCGGRQFGPFRCIGVGLLLMCLPTLGRADDWLSFPGRADAGPPRHVVLVSGDEEYRSEEALVHLANILATHHGFRCTVLFAIDPTTKIIQPNVQTNIPGLMSLATADLLVVFTRFRNLPDDQMQRLDAYLKSGRPVLGIRTATHAFLLNETSSFRHYSNGYDGNLVEWQGGFGRLVLGEQWVAHHGEHKHESTRGVLAPEASHHPISRGLSDGDVWGPTDVYAVRLPLAGGQPLILGQVVRRTGRFDELDVRFGMRPSDPPDLETEKNRELMPVAWTRTYQLPEGRPGRAMVSTIGASADLLEAGTRRLLVHGVFWCMGLEELIPPGGATVDLVGDFQPTQFAFRTDEYWQQRALRPRDLLPRQQIQSATRAEKSSKLADPPPRVVWERNRKAVEYQLRRLPLKSLLAIHRDATDTRMAPLYWEFLLRRDVPRRVRIEALAALQSQDRGSRADILLTAIRRIQPDDNELFRELVGLFGASQDGSPAATLEAAVEDESAKVRMAALIMLAEMHGTEVVWHRSSPSQQLDLLGAVPMIPSQVVRESILEPIMDSLREPPSDEFANAALRALVSIESHPEQRFAAAVNAVDSGELRARALELMHSIAPRHYTADGAREVLPILCDAASKVPLEQRGEPSCQLVLECGRHLASVLDEAEKRSWLDQLNSVSVRVIHVATVYDQMRYDSPYIAVEPNERIELVLENRDVMPHNLVITVPGALEEIGKAADRLTSPLATRIPYVPDSPKVLFATEMVAPGQQAKLLLTAPAEPGAYPYVCTFPNHWFRMYGMMLVVDNLRTWSQNPVIPADPLGRTRRLVKRWQIEDFSDWIDPGAETSPSTDDRITLGQLVLQQAGCNKCHRVACQGATIGPALDGVFERLGRDRRRLLKEIIDPSEIVADEYANYMFVLHDGGILSGILSGRTASSISVLSSPEDTAPRVVPLRDIEELVRLNTSLMPGGLVDEFSRDEIHALVTYLEQLAAEPPLETMRP